jgi:hypothetical protein
MQILSTEFRDYAPRFRPLQLQKKVATSSLPPPTLVLIARPKPFQQAAACPSTACSDSKSITAAAQLTPFLMAQTRKLVDDLF